MIVRLFLRGAGRLYKRVIGFGMNSFNTKSAVLRTLTALFAAGGIAFASAQSNCITFESPLAGSVFPEPSCTISLNVECRNVTRIDLRARYIPENGDSAEIFLLSTISRAPYKFFWNTQDLPNQLFTGIGILAEASISGGEPQVARQEGVFLTHNKVERKRIPIPYSPQSIGGEAYAQTFKMGSPQESASAVVSWNEKELTFYVSVKDPNFYISQPGKNIADAGLEIMIDPARKRTPYPADSTLFFVIPLSGAPYSIHYRAETADGSFKLVPQASHVNNTYTYNVGINEFKGYSVRFSVPKEAVGKTMPDTIGCNMALRLLDADGKVQKVSLTDGNLYEMYSPFSWHDYYRLKRPLFMNSALQWIIFSAAGFFIALAVYALTVRLRKPQLLTNFERSEEDKVLFERVNAVIERELIKKDLKIDYVAEKCGMNQQALNALIKRNTGFNFINYLQYCRTEVAKERLRSSRSSETSIADLCGFSSAIEMEKCFGKFHHTTPYKFRMRQQVA
jgi:AraC-like DNA-binding protein